MNRLKQKNTTKLWQRVVAIFLCVILAFGALAVPASAAGADFGGVSIETGSDQMDSAMVRILTFLSGLTLSVGLGLLIFGVAEFGLSYVSQNDGQKSQGLKFCIAGIIVALGPSLAIYFFSGVTPTF